MSGMRYEVQRVTDNELVLGGLQGQDHQTITIEGKLPSGLPEQESFTLGSWTELSINTRQATTPGDNTYKVVNISDDRMVLTHQDGVRSTITFTGKVPGYLMRLETGQLYDVNFTAKTVSAAKEQEA